MKSARYLKIKRIQQDAYKYTNTLNYLPDFYGISW